MSLLGLSSLSDSPRQLERQAFRDLEQIGSLHDQQLADGRWNVLCSAPGSTDTKQNVSSLPLRSTFGLSWKDL